MTELMGPEDRQHTAAVPHSVDQQSRQGERWRRIAELGDVRPVEERSGQRRRDECQDEEDDVPPDRNRPRRRRHHVRWRCRVVSETDLRISRVKR